MNGKVKVAAFSVSLDGYGAGPAQDADNPLGVRGHDVHAWMHKTRMFHKMLGQEGGTDGVDNGFADRSMEGYGAWVMGRNMFGPVRGPWPDESWKGWWGDNPPYHTPVFVLTHHARRPLEMAGGNVFHFVTDGIESALKQARAAAKGKDVRVGGGVSVIRQCLTAGLIDEMHLVVSPTLLGSGENLFAGMNLSELGFACSKHVAGEGALHVFLSRTPKAGRK